MLSPRRIYTPQPTERSQNASVGYSVYEEESGETEGEGEREGGGEGPNIHKFCQKVTVLQSFATIMKLYGRDAYQVTCEKHWWNSTDFPNIYLKRNIKKILILICKMSSIDRQIHSTRVGWHEEIDKMYGKLNNTESELLQAVGMG